MGHEVGVKWQQGEIQFRNWKLLEEEVVRNFIFIYSPRPKAKTLQTTTLRAPKPTYKR
jgi:hypothetical protein